MTSHDTWGPVTTLHDFGGVLGRSLDAFSFELSQSCGHGSWLVCEVALGPIFSHHTLNKINLLRISNIVRAFASCHFDDSVTFRKVLDGRPSKRAAFKPSKRVTDEPVCFSKLLHKIWYLVHILFEIMQCYIYLLCFSYFTKNGKLISVDIMKH